jgi:hypothetical protein
VSTGRAWARPRCQFTNVAALKRTLETGGASWAAPRGLAPCEQQAPRFMMGGLDVVVRCPGRHIHKPPTMGSERYRVIGDAPGEYVHG